MELLIKSIGFKADQKLKDYIESKIIKIDRFYDRIGKVTVNLKLENSGQVKDKITELTVDTPGRLIVAKSSAKSFESSFDQAYSNAKRQVKRRKERQRSR